MAGLSSTGLTIKTLPEVLTDINDKQKASPILGSDWDTSTTSPEGVMNGIVSEAIAEGWQVLAAIYNQRYPDGAEGVQLDRVAEFTGSKRLAAASSTVKVVCAGTDATELGSFRTVSVAGGENFFSTADAEIVTVDAWVAATEYEVYDLVTNDSGKLYVCTTAGESAGSGGPTGSGSTEITDNDAAWFYVAEETAGVVVDFESENTGEIAANAGTLTQIETAVGGWSTAFNPFDAALGRARETDAAFRARRQASLRVQGAAATDAIRSDVLDIEDVTACIVFENDTDTTDGDGLPPHSVEVLVLGGEDQDIFDTILATKAAGIATYGGETGTATDASDNDHTIYFTRPTEKDVYITVDVTVLGSLWPSDGEDQVAAALVAFGDDLDTGDDVVRSQLFGPVRTVSGVYDVTNIKLGFSAAPAGTTNLTIATREIAAFDTSRIVVNVTTL
jgi:uncharacterized phage protein gp47/JayE